MDLQHFTHLFFNGMKRIERAHRLLKDHRNGIAAQAAHMLLAGGEQIFPALEIYLARWMGSRRIGQQAHYGKGRNRLARTRFANQRHGLAGLYVKGDMADRMGEMIALAKINRKITHLDQQPLAGRGRFLGFFAFFALRPLTTSRLQAFVIPAMTMAAVTMAMMMAPGGPGGHFAALFLAARFFHISAGLFLFPIAHTLG